MITLTFREFIETYAKPINKCYRYKEYSEEIINLIIEVYYACRRFMLHYSHTIYILDIILSNINTEEIKKRNTTDENIVNLFAEYLGVTRTTIYNIRRKYRKEKQNGEKYYNVELH